MCTAWAWENPSGRITRGLEIDWGPLLLNSISILGRKGRGPFSAGDISPACYARSLPCAWCMHGGAYRSSLSSPCRFSSVLSVVVFLRGTSRFFGGFRDRGWRISPFIGRLVGFSCCWLGCGATGVAACVSPFIPRPPRAVHRSFWVFRVGSSL